MPTKNISLIESQFHPDVTRTYYPLLQVDVNDLVFQVFNSSKKDVTVFRPRINFTTKNLDLTIKL